MRAGERARARFAGLTAAAHQSQNRYDAGLGGYMRRAKLINRVLRAQEPPRNRLEWRRQPFWCQYCGARFGDRNELLAHLEAEKQRDQTAPKPY